MTDLCFSKLRKSEFLIGNIVFRAQCSSSEVLFLKFLKGNRSKASQNYRGAFGPQRYFQICFPLIPKNYLEERIPWGSFEKSIENGF